MQREPDHAADTCAIAAAELNEILIRFHAFIEPDAMWEDPVEYSDLIERLEATAALLASAGAVPAVDDTALFADLEAIATSTVGAIVRRDPVDPAHAARVAAHVHRLEALQGPEDAS